ncbi:SDR family NAD(P)-dependent oxidoreductase [Caulobacter soli]|uniref:SDR family NAD(P)-dependent oxidoreductase n=1 Tax=Caulobacter soli TaxID=2708539 RepID=UPI0013E9B4FA|nr:SDR family NAD(P)-dependent oxidoreductase [Caulobacter soli]
MSFLAKYGPWAVVAGASEGTGQAFARRLAADGVNCVLIARREAPLTALADELRARHGVDCITASIDLAKSDAFDRIVEAVGEREVGLFIANAGGDPHGTTFLDQPVDSWIDLITRNVTTAVRCCHHFGGKMRERGTGGLLLVGSGACYGGANNMAVYSGSKAFDMCLAEGLWAELKPHGVDVLYLSLGRTDTPELRRFLTEKGLPVPSDLATPEAVAELGLERLPHGPIQNFGQADDEVGRLPQSAAQRRQRVEMIAQASQAIYGKK